MKIFLTAIALLSALPAAAQQAPTAADFLAQRVGQDAITIANLIEQVGALRKENAALKLDLEKLQSESEKAKTP